MSPGEGIEDQKRMMERERERQKERERDSERERERPWHGGRLGVVRSYIHIYNMFYIINNITHMYLRNVSYVHV